MCNNSRDLIKRCSPGFDLLRKQTVCVLKPCARCWRIVCASWALCVAFAGVLCDISYVLQCWYVVCVDITTVSTYRSASVRAESLKLGYRRLPTTEKKRKKKKKKKKKNTTTTTTKKIIM